MASRAERSAESNNRRVTLEANSPLCARTALLRSMRHVSQNQESPNASLRFKVSHLQNKAAAHREDGVIF